MKKEAGSIGDFLAVCICMIMMTILMTVYMDCVHIIEEKEEINQIARKYILRMESTGYLAEEDKNMLLRELELSGITEINLEDSTMVRTGYGEEIVLRIRGRLEGNHEIDEKKVSTAKY